MTTCEIAELTCTEPGCLTIRAEREAVCSRHLMMARRRAGLCANCGGERERVPVVNDLTGSQLKRYGEPVWQMRCVGCGRSQRAEV